jgi:hypothetical protein
MKVFRIQLPSGNIVRFVAILAALLGSWLAVTGVLANIESQDDRAAEERNARLQASKAMLPSILAELSRRCEHNAMVVLLNSKNALLPGETLPTHLEKFQEADIAPFVSDYEFNAYKECIEVADERDGRILSYIVHRYQVCFSQCFDNDFLEVERDHFDRISDGKSLNMAYAWNCLNMLMEHCLPYSRSKESNISNRFASSRFGNVFSQTRQSEFTTVVRVVSDYINHAETMSKGIIEDLADANGDLDLAYLIRQEFL